MPNKATPVTVESIVDEVAEFITQVFEGRKFPVKPKRYGEDSEPVPINVYPFTLDQASDVIDKIPYIVIRFIEITDKEKSDGIESILLLRIIVVQYAKDLKEGYRQGTQMIDTLRNAFLTHRFISGVEVVEPFEAMLYEDQTEDPYYVGEIMLSLKLPNLNNDYTVLFDENFWEA